MKTKAKLMLAITLLFGVSATAANLDLVYDSVDTVAVMNVPNFGTYHPLSAPQNVNTGIRISGYIDGGTSSELWISGHSAYSTSDAVWLASCEQKALLVVSNPTKYKLRVSLFNYVGITKPIVSISLGNGDAFCSIEKK